MRRVLPVLLAAAAGITLAIAVAAGGRSCHAHHGHCNPPPTTTTTEPPPTTEPSPPPPPPPPPPTGQDWTCTSAAVPGMALQAFVDTLGPGDTGCLHGGTYALTSELHFNHSGTSSAPLRLFNYPDERPVLDGAAITSDDYIVDVGGSDWLHLRGLDISHARNRPYGVGGITCYLGDHDTFEQLDIHDTGYVGIVLYQCNAATVLDTDLHDNVNRGDPVQGDYGQADGIDVTGGSTGAVLTGNRAWRNSDDGFDFWEAGGVHASGNWAFENGLGDVNGDGVLDQLGDGNGLKLGQGSAQHYLHNNLAWRNKADGFDQNGNSSALTLVNNTAWDNSAQAGWLNFELAGQDHVTNNAAFGRGGTANGSWPYNTWTLPVTVSAGDFQSLDYTAATGPRASDGSLPVLPFLHLADGSDLVDAGTRVGLPYNGAAPDLGAYEK